MFTTAYQQCTKIVHTYMYTRITCIRVYKECNTFIQYTCDCTSMNVSVQALCIRTCMYTLIINALKGSVRIMIGKFRDFPEYRKRYIKLIRNI